MLLLPKIAPDNQATVGGRAINDTLQPVDFLGPFEVLDSQTIGERRDGARTPGALGAGRF